MNKHIRLIFMMMRYFVGGVFSAVLIASFSWAQSTPVKDDIVPVINEVTPAVDEATPVIDLALQAKKEALGAILFNDPSLSNPAGQSCATCHKASAAFSDAGRVVSEGVIKGKFGPRNTPSLTYARFSPALGKEDYGDDWVGGQFWDGRAQSLQEQALGPLLNPVEMNNTLEGLAKTLRASVYWPQFIAIYGEVGLKDDQAIAEAAGNALQAFQRTDVFAPFSAKWDYASAGILQLTEQETLGEQIYSGTGSCFDCHSGIAEDSFQVYTGFKMHNILVPKNPALPFYTQAPDVNPDGARYLDLGAGLNERIALADRMRLKGAFKTPTLRNVALTAPYMHNGVFATLDEVIEFYRDVNKFAPPEVDGIKSTLLTVKLTIDDNEKLALIAFLNTLTDGYPATPEQKARLKAAHAAWRAHSNLLNGP
ncbi:MAG: cytochrome c peroxidase [Marinagarivorans sp.]|nr:cytochrome c peroxidase [Marinagarivorans sp.]